LVTKLYIGNSRLDLYKDENIALTSSIADTQDITKNTTDFTKSFTVPASNINNGIFKHYYDATIDNSFDARIKIDGRIELDGIPFKTGKWRLSKVSVKHGKADSYTINFWGNLVDLPAKLKNLELKDLDLSAYNHDYDGANVLTGLTSSLFSGAIVYNLLAKKQLYYNNDAADNKQTDILANIAFGGGAATGVKFSDLRPAIQVIKIIEAIETDLSLTFSRDFFGRAEFSQLYLWLNNDTDANVGGSIQIVDFDDGDTTNVNLTTDIGTFTAVNTSASGDRRFWELQLTITPSLGYGLIDYTIRMYKDDEITKEQAYTGGTKTLKYTLIRDGGAQTYEIFYDVIAESEFKYTASWKQEYKSTSSTLATYTTTASENTIDPFIDVSDNIPKIKLTDFLKGLFKAFKLVVIPQEDGTLYINTLKSYYAEGVLYDYTKYINFDSYDVERGNILNEINFNFEAPTTLLNVQFENNNRIAYGDEEAQLTDSAGEPLDGDKQDFKLPFEQVIYERLNDLDDNTETNIQYGAIVDEEIQGVNPKPHIFYNILQSVGVKTIAFIDEDGTRSEISTTINTASHSETFEQQQYAFLFSSEFSTWDGELMANTLYSNYHQEYINDLFNIKRRNWSFKAQLPLDKLSVLELNDILKIKDDYYRIDKFDLNLLTGEANLKLINAFDTQIGAFTPSETSIYVDYQAQQASIYVTFLNNYSYNKTDLGSGTAWITVSNVGSNIFFDFTENATGSIRDMEIVFTNTDTSQEFTIYLNQSL